MEDIEKGIRTGVRGVFYKLILGTQDYESCMAYDTNDSVLLFSERPSVPFLGPDNLSSFYLV